MQTRVAAETVTNTETDTETEGNLEIDIEKDKKNDHGPIMHESLEKTPGVVAKQRQGQ